MPDHGARFVCFTVASSDGNLAIVRTLLKTVPNFPQVTYLNFTEKWHSRRQGLGDHGDLLPAILDWAMGIELYPQSTSLVSGWRCRSPWIQLELYGVTAW